MQQMPMCIKAELDQPIWAKLTQDKTLAQPTNFNYFCARIDTNHKQPTSTQHANTV